MGQYYKPINVENKQWLYNHEYDNGLKLMEHSYIGNDVMNAVESLLIPGGAWYKTPVVWAGDYADAELALGNEEEDNLYHLCQDDKKIHPPSDAVDEKYHYLTNHTKHLVIDLTTIQPDEDDFRIHPLSLLVAEGNGRGGGDFYGEDERIGTWARDIISLEDHICEGYQVQDGQFKEDR